MIGPRAAAAGGFAFAVLIALGAWWSYQAGAKAGAARADAILVQARLQA